MQRPKIKLFNAKSVIHSNQVGSFIEISLIETTILNQKYACICKIFWKIINKNDGHRQRILL